MRSFLNGRVSSQAGRLELARGLPLTKRYSNLGCARGGSSLLNSHGLEAKPARAGHDLLNPRDAVFGLRELINRIGGGDGDHSNPCTASRPDPGRGVLDHYGFL